MRDHRNQRVRVVRTDSTHRAAGQRWDTLPRPRWVVALLLLGSVSLIAGFLAGPYPFAVGVVMLLAFFIYNSGPHYTHELLHNRRCPCCLYDLRTLARAPDDRTVCPECGAAWKLPTDR
ncbi:MAG: hypothetical protein AAGH64_02895 [Planctomycetota bacterium]